MIFKEHPTDSLKRVKVKVAAFFHPASMILELQSKHVSLVQSSFLNFCQFLMWPSWFYAFLPFQFGLYHQAASWTPTHCDNRSLYRVTWASSILCSFVGLSCKLLGHIFAKSGFLLHFCPPLQFVCFLITTIFPDSKGSRWRVSLTLPLYTLSHKLQMCCPDFPFLPAW